jgi:hypothetical protein
MRQRTSAAADRKLTIWAIELKIDPCCEWVCSIEWAERKPLDADLRKSFARKKLGSESAAQKMIKNKFFLFCLLSHCPSVMTLQQLSCWSWIDRQISLVMRFFAPHATRLIMLPCELSHKLRGVNARPLPVAVWGLLHCKCLCPSSEK